MTMLREYFEKTTHISNSPNTQSGVKKAEEGGFQRCLASIEVLEEAFTSSESRSKSALDSMNEFELHITKFKDECLKARGMVFTLFSLCEVMWGNLDREMAQG